ncbi:MAG: (2Fe-2S)-binding protein [Candidatus Omnitrophica bacterium]|nr:(2Fe-2S)-binding protein [Candidatus Omnitrophota bacterium]
MKKLTINNKEYLLDLKGHETLLEVLRDKLSLTGTKTACEESECGTCTVEINGKAVLSCITLAADIEGEAVTTIEGLADGDKLHPVQQAYVDYGAVQCGFCIPGMIMSSKALLDKNPSPTQEEIEYALDGNICRCAGYPKIFDAVRKAGEVMKNGGNLEQAVVAAQDKFKSTMAKGITYEDFLKMKQT